MEDIYQKYNPEFLAATNQNPGARPSAQEGQLELVSAAQNLNAISHQFGLDPTIQMMGVNITDSTPKKSGYDFLNQQSVMESGDPTGGR